MLYYVFYQIIFKTYGNDSESYLFKGLNVFQYVTFRTALAATTSLLISLLLGNRLIRQLRQWEIGQPIREELSPEHQEKKGTPTMGGILIIASVTIAALLWGRLDALYLWIALVAMLLFAAIGFADDAIKILKRQSLGLTGKQKLAGQLAVAPRSG